ncbi:hypothetical protein D9757_008848 [Collybiopsis confluens]|uniref:Uncharacterized protein n=1 Tax=Collybiopsis confluens TaxID=2823264 RepID=A0A8H5H3P2_9AGAR|nr:hypothetical protein D9757_008848 [Collybiopsis confluens]
MAKYTERQSAAIGLMKAYILYWKRRADSEKKEDQKLIDDFGRVGYPEEFAREEIIPVLRGYFGDTNQGESIIATESSSSSESGSDPSSSSSSPSSSSSSSSSSSPSSSSSSSSSSSASPILPAQARFTQEKISLRRKRSRIRYQLERLGQGQSSSDNTCESESTASSASDGELSDGEADADEDMLDECWDLLLAEQQATYIMAFIEKLYSKRYLRPRNKYRRPPGHLRHTLDVWTESQPDQFRENLRIMPIELEATYTKLRKFFVLCKHAARIVLGIA